MSGVQLYPNLGEPLRKSPGAALSFYAVVLPGSAAVTATLTLQQNGTTLATLPLTLAAPDAAAASGSSAKSCSRPFRPEATT